VTLAISSKFKRTTVTPFSPVPVIVIVVPTGPDEGVKLEIEGDAVAFLLHGVPPPVRTIPCPELADGVEAVVSTS
jgi:hypothetical protein